MPDQTYTSAEYAQQWQRVKKMRSEDFEAATEMMLDMAQIREGNRVLEIAAGTGDLAVTTARCVGTNGYVLATDISASMVNLTAETAREAGVTNVETLVMDADSLDLPEASFDAALCRSALMNFPYPIKALAGVHRAMKSSGKFAVTVFSTREKNPYHSIPLVIASPSRESTILTIGRAWNVRTLRQRSARRVLGASPAKTPALSNERLWRGGPRVKL